MNTERLFSYGTLQLEAVQLANFGRRLTGSPDTLVRFRAEEIEIRDEATVKLSGKSHHTIATFTGNRSDTIVGTVYELTPDELISADTYEVAEYKRVAVILGSGQRSWVYVDARNAPPDT
jgi:gamma-glutamylcyclotransferase (GGCT)/AIG2-like uncharacterized protein YtfP